MKMVVFNYGGQVIELWVTDKDGTNSENQAKKTLTKSMEKGILNKP